MVNRAELDRLWVELGQRLAASRRAARLSQTALGGLIGCVRSTVSHIERARRRSDRTFWKLADQHCRADGELLAAFDALEAAEADYRARREVQQARAELDRLAASRAPAGPPSIAASPASPLDPNTVEAGPELGVSGELLRLMERLAGLVDRRELLRLMRWATTTAAGALDSQLSGCLVKLGRPREALEAAQAAAGRFDPSFRGMHARCQMRLATALVQCEEIGEAARILGAAAGTASVSPSPRLTAELRATRAQLQPWQGTHAVKTLDAQLAACGVLGPSLSSGV